MSAGTDASRPDRCRRGSQTAHPHRPECPAGGATSSGSPAETSSQNFSRPGCLETWNVPSFRVRRLYRILGSSSSSNNFRHKFQVCSCFTRETPTHHQMTGIKSALALCWRVRCAAPTTGTRILGHSEPVESSGLTRFRVSDRNSELRRGQKGRISRSAPPDRNSTIFQDIFLPMSTRSTRRPGWTSGRRFFAL